MRQGGREGEKERVGARKGWAGGREGLESEGMKEK